MKLISEYKIHIMGIAILGLVNITGNPLPPDISLQKGLVIWGALFLLVAVQWMGIVSSVRASWKKYKKLNQVNRRLTMSFLLSMAWVMPLMALADFITRRFLHQMTIFDIVDNVPFYFFNSVILSFTAIGATEAVYYYNRLRLAEQEKEQLRQINLMTQYDSLKQQVNPHFLFNSLNTLTSLIAIDSRKAEKFVEEMSQVYRYLLQSNQEELVDLEDELKFIRSYFHLLKTRFGGSLQVSIEIPEIYYTYKVPPLTLQLLVENAVKHNEVSSNNPLYIHIGIDEKGYLKITNNLQKKIVSLPSAKIGLANIMAKYRLLGQQPTEVLQTESEFIVKLPLVK